MEKSMYVMAIDGMFSARDIGSVTVTEKGVAVTDAAGNLKYWHEEHDKKNAKLVSKHLTKAIMSAATDEPYQADWEELGLA
jgi:hypothetical protein